MIRGNLSDVDRRGFLSPTAAALGSAAVPGLFSGLLHAAAPRETVSPHGGIVLCEDGERTPQKLALSRDGRLSELAWNNVQLHGEKHGFKWDFRGSEFAGATFSPDGKWLFVNVQDPGIKLAITGPWESLGL